MKANPGLLFLFSLVGSWTFAVLLVARGAVMVMAFAGGLPRGGGRVRLELSVPWCLHTYVMEFMVGERPL